LARAYGWTEREDFDLPAETPANLSGAGRRMTHFLGRLVERAPRTAPRVEPIIAPRFAPAGSLGGELLPEISSEVEVRPMTPAPAEPNIVTKTAGSSAPQNKIASAPLQIVKRKMKTLREIVTERLLVPQFEKEPKSLVVRQMENVDGEFSLHPDPPPLEDFSPGIVRGGRGQRPRLPHNPAPFEASSERRLRLTSRRTSRRSCGSRSGRIEVRATRGRRATEMRPVVTRTIGGSCADSLGVIAVRSRPRGRGVVW